MKIIVVVLAPVNNSSRGTAVGNQQTIRQWIGRIAENVVAFGNIVNNATNVAQIVSDVIAGTAWRVACRQQQSPGKMHHKPLAN